MDLTQLSEDNFERKFQAKLSPPNKKIEEQEEELIQLKVKH